MLQWMGGARRKVNASRKSTRNRQKQYFEQRKRLQQPTGPANSDILREQLPDNHKELRSLDILSLLNLATAEQQENSTHDNVGSHESATLTDTFPCQIVKESLETGVPKLNSDVSNVSSAPVLKKLISKYANDLQKACTKQENLMDNNSSAASYTKLSAHKSDQQFDGSHRPDNSGIFPEVSVLDLLNDDDHGGVSDRRLVPEAHVAFSVEGLGNMGVATPAQSPHCKARDCSPPPRASRPAYSSEKLKPIVYDFGFELDDLTSDVKIADNESLTGKSYNHGHMVDELQCKKRSKVWGSIPDVYNSKNSSFMPDENFFTYVDDMEEQDLLGTQTGCPLVNAGTFDEIFVDERTYEPAFIVDRKRGFPISLEDDDSDCDFGIQLPISTADRTLRASKGKFDNSEPFSPHFRHSPSGKDSGFVSFDSKRIPSINKRSNFQSIFYPHPWSSFADEAEHDRSSLSEESCSSAAVREGNYTAQCAKKMHNNISFSDEEENTPASKFDGSFDTFHCKQASDPCGRSEQYSESAAFLQTVCDPLNTKKCTVKAASASGLFYTVSAKRERSFSNKLLPEENLLDSFCIPKLSPNTDMKHIRSKSIFQDGQVMCGKLIHKSSPEWRRENTFQNASCQWDFTKHAHFPDASKKFGNNSQDASTRGSDMPQLIGSMKKPLKSGDRASATEGECKSSSIEQEESKLRTQESKDCQKLRDDQLEESILVGDVLDRRIHDKIHLYGSSSPLPFQLRNAESRNERPEIEMSEECKSWNGSDASSQVMLGSYVLQLLCVQKVLMEASGDNLKKGIQGAWLDKIEEPKGS